MRAVLSSASARRAIFVLLLGAASAASAQDQQAKVREFFGIPYKHPETAELAAAREKAYNDMLWIQGAMSGSVLFLFLIGLYSLLTATSDQPWWAQQTVQPPKAKNDDLLRRLSNSTFEIE